MTLEGPLTKMRTDYTGGVVDYYLSIGDAEVHMNPLIDHSLQIGYLGTIRCFCGKEKEKVYRQNFCYRCFYELPEASECIFKPELCEGHLGKGRDPEWEREHHLKPHFVYLAISSGLKVGVTRASQIPTRWIDQGATRALRIAEVPYRYLAGRLEVELKAHLNDKTNWRKMLKKESPPDIDLLEERDKALDLVSDDLREYFLEEEEVMTIHYPDDYALDKIKSLNPAKQSRIEAELAGIKGQYLVFQDGSVLNVRNYAGYQVRFSTVEGGAFPRQGTLFK